ncbi:mCG144995, partial [Mus musculus]
EQAICPSDGHVQNSLIWTNQLIQIGECSPSHGARGWRFEGWWHLPLSTSASVLKGNSIALSSHEQPGFSLTLLGHLLIKKQKQF